MTPRGLGIRTFEMRQPPRPRDRLSGSEKRRARKGGNPDGGPGKKGAGMRPSTPRMKRGYLV